MTRTRTPGITVDADGKRTIDKEHRGTRLFRRLGNLSQEKAEQRLHAEIERLDAELFRKAVGGEFPHTTNSPPTGLRRGSVV